MDILSTIQQLSKQEKKTLLERMVKLQEEAGELANEVLISQKASGSERKKSQKKGIRKEAIDVVLVALSIYFHQGATLADLEKDLKLKSMKWKKGSCGSSS
ncbi:MAG: MazG-like family protein [Parachlamydiales bacterium]|nr:MazG-like family protein [Verrucomicrobiota bacterium]MBX3719105.1 MazG-like family protein [Candidatus Acheromyda pituitae]